MSETSEIFVIFENGSDYEATPEAIGYAETEEQADKICYTLSYYYQQLLAFQAMLDFTLKKIRDEEMEFEKIMDWPRWPAGISESMITKEMRDERAEIQAKNEEIRNRKSEFAELKMNKIKKGVAEELLKLDDSEQSKYIKAGITPFGGINQYLYPYTNQKLKKLI